MLEENVEVRSEGVVVVADRWLTRLAESPPVIGEDAVAGLQQDPFLLLPGRPVERIAMNQHHWLARAVVFVVDRDRGAVLGSDDDARHGQTPGRRVVTSWTSQRLPSGSVNEQNDP